MEYLSCLIRRRISRLDLWADTIGICHEPFAPVGRLYPDARWIRAQYDGRLPFIFAAIGEFDLYPITGMISVVDALGHGNKGKRGGFGKARPSLL